VGSGRRSGASSRTRSCRSTTTRENALRVVALGRKNFLFLGSDEAGENTAGLYSLVATCQANGVNPEAYLADVLLRVQTHPAADVDALLPDRWRPRDTS
jgi:transposase